MRPNYAQVAAAVYQACTQYDQYLPQLSPDVAGAWAKTFAYYNLSPEDLLAGVDAVYREHGSGYRPLPADITKAAREIRNDRWSRTDEAERSLREQKIDAKIAEHVAEIAAGMGIPDDDLKYRRPSHNPLTVRCSFCGADPGWHCTHGGTRQPMRTYHPSRVESAKESA